MRILSANIFILASWCASESYAANCVQPVGHLQNPCEDDVDSPFIDKSHIPTEATTSSPSDAPSSVPSDMPSLSPTFSPTSTPTTFECATQDGYYGVIGSAEEVFTIEFGYEIEATADANIESDVLPLVEKAVTDSILGEIFTECSDRRKLKAIRRRLEITGVTQDPEDLILQDVVCGEFLPENECVVVSGALDLYATKDSASAMEESILEAIRANMEQGKFDKVHPKIVRVTYTELESDKADGSESSGSDNSVGDDNTPVLVGSLVAAGVLMAAVVAVAYRRRARGDSSEDATATELGAQPTEST